MDRNLNDFVWFDQRFIADHGKISEDNWLEYLQQYPEFDPNCLNNNLPEGNKLTLKQCRDYNRPGFFYDCRQVNNVLVVNKYEFQKETVTLITVYYIFEGSVLNAKNFKELLYRKCGNIGSILFDLAESFADFEELQI